MPAFLRRGSHRPALSGRPGVAARSRPLGRFGYDNNINIHHNKITNNGTIESNIGENGGGGGVSICSGTDNYALNYNFICGNYSQGDGGGVGHVGLSNPGTIAHNRSSLTSRSSRVEHHWRRDCD